MMKEDSGALAPARTTGPLEALADRQHGVLRSLAITCFIAFALTVCVEFVARGSLTDSLAFVLQPYRPGWATVALFTLILVALDALLGRAHMGLLALAPVALALAATGRQKAYYLGDPLYPADFLYSRQIMELLPLLVRERIGTAIVIVIALAALVALAPMAWIRWRRRGQPLEMRARAMRLALALPLIVGYASILDYSTFSWTRDRLGINPMMWDQKTNYEHNGFTLAFALNVPMAKVSAPAGYSADAINVAGGGRLPAVAMPQVRPDIIMIMSESLWDPSRLPGIGFSSDPMASIREAQKGHVFSPEFGGMTANVEFEALTGFSNAFLPYGSIPYQQYVREALPTLPSFLRNQGYETQAMHPFEGWFWNRSEVYKAFGFQDFRSQENLPKLEKRGTLASDAALTEQIISRAETATDPLFLFAVTLQSHGPYEPGRYGDTAVKVSGAPDKWTTGSIETYAQGVADADGAFRRLIEWAETRERPTIVVLFGDHLPPMGPAYVNTGFLDSNVAPRGGPAAEMKRVRETPLVIWSNRNAKIAKVGTVSPSFLPLLVMREAGMSHPYYTGVLGELHARYPVVERHLLIDAKGGSMRDWSRATTPDPLMQRMHLIQYDMLFGKRHGEKKLFPKRTVWGPLIAGTPPSPALRSDRNPV